MRKIIVALSVLCGCGIFPAIAQTPPIRPAGCVPIPAFTMPIELPPNAIAAWVVWIGKKEAACPDSESQTIVFNAHAMHTVGNPLPTAIASDYVASLMFTPEDILRSYGLTVVIAFQSKHYDPAQNIAFARRMNSGRVSGTRIEQVSPIVLMVPPPPTQDL